MVVEMEVWWRSGGGGGGGAADLQVASWTAVCIYLFSRQREASEATAGRARRSRDTTCRLRVRGRMCACVRAALACVRLKTDVCCHHSRKRFHPCAPRRPGLKPPPWPLYGVIL